MDTEVVIVYHGGQMHYFAYGSNLNKRQMQERCPNCKPMFLATLHHYKLIFTGWSRQWRGGIASIKSFRGGKVPGAIYELSEAELKRLDKYEGYPDVYTRMKVIVNNEDGEPVEAVTYIRQGQIEETQPSKEYAEVMKQGYIDWGII
ncbi:MAG: gamma-glutamylcyclotransferase [Chloroflexi bacterium]|nr:gamma-glutamylcyclotransferase [Chloroflexota bacterium]